MVTANKAQLAYDGLKNLIHSGKFPQGERLSEAKAARLLGMSRGPVRDSILRLESEGLLGHRGHRRSRVVLFTEEQEPSDLLFRYELREQIEGAAARLAAKNMTGWQIDRLYELARQVEELEQSGDRQGRGEKAQAFHQYLVENCGNPFLIEIWEAYHLRPTRPKSVEFEQQVKANLPLQGDGVSLTEVIDAIAARDSEGAEQLIRRRINRITEALRRTILSGSGAADSPSRRSSLAGMDGKETRRVH